MSKKTGQKLVCMMLVSIFSLLLYSVSYAEAPRMSKEELKSQLDNENVIIIDVRTKRDWKKSDHKVKGAVRENPRKLESWASKYPKDKTLVLYCA